MRTRATTLVARSLIFATFFGVHKFALLKIFVCFQDSVFHAHVKGVSERSELTPCIMLLRVHNEKCNRKKERRSVKEPHAHI